MTMFISEDNLNVPTPNGMISATVVLTGGTLAEHGIHGDLAAYVGVGNIPWIMKNGRKLSFAEAKAHFPTLEEADYRK
jgi:hypothetical protein